MTKTSVIIPAFNAERFIDGALASASAQTEADLEILVVDDGSTDGTRERVEAAAGRDRRIRLLRTAQNGGPSAARNVGLEAARGEWIAPLDADDAFAPDRLANLLALAHAHGADMASDNLALVDESGAELGPMFPPTWLAEDQPLTTAGFIAGNVGDPRHPRVSYGFMKPLMRRALIDAHAIRYDETVRFAEDFGLYLRCLRAGAVWWATPRPMYRYLVRANSLTEVQSSADLDRLRTVQRAMLRDIRRTDDPELHGAVRRHLRGIDRNYYYRATTDALKPRRLGEAPRILGPSPGAAALVAREALRQTPAILHKFRRGGYRR